MSEKYDKVKEFGKHINYGIDKFDEIFEPNLENLKTNKIIELTEYQKFAASLFLIEEFKNLLLFWETGFGKTIACVYIIKNIFIIYPEWKIFLFVKSSLRNDPWKKEIDQYIPNNIKNKIYFIHYDILNADNLFLINKEAVKKTERVLFIFDEVHDFIKKLLPKEGDNDRRLYKLIKPLLEDINKHRNKALFMSATPIHNNIIEFNYLMYFVRNGNMKINQELFDKENLLINSSSLKKCCLGMASFQRRSDIDIFKNIPPGDSLAGKKIHFVDLIMSQHQTSMYRYASNIEVQSRARGFRVIRKLVNTLAYHDLKIKKGMDSEEYERMLKEQGDLFFNKINNLKFSDTFISDFKNKTLNIRDSTLCKNLDLYSENRTSFVSSLEVPNETKDVLNLKLLNSYSSKYIKTCQLILEARGKCLIYQPFVTFAGVKTLLLYFNKFNITYIEYTKNTKNIRSDLIKAFNEKDNIYGEKIKVCVLSGAGTEGISFTNITDLILMDIPWSGSIVEQIFGRAIRLNSHKELPLEERYVNIFILINYTSGEPSLSIDRELLDFILLKEKQKIQLLDVLLSSSIETIHNRYPDIESVEKPDFFPLINYKYHIENAKNKNISMLKDMIKIQYTFDINYLNYYSGYLDELNNFVYSDTDLIGKLIIVNEKPQFKIIDNLLVYLIQNID